MGRQSRSWSVVQPFQGESCGRLGTPLGRLGDRLAGSRELRRGPAAWGTASAHPVELWSVTALPPDDGVVLHAEDRRPAPLSLPESACSCDPAPCAPACCCSRLSALSAASQMTLGQEVSCPDCCSGSETLIAADIAALDLFHKPPFVLFGGFQMCLGQEMRHLYARSDPKVTLPQTSHTESLSPYFQLPVLPSRDRVSPFPGQLSSALSLSPPSSHFCCASYRVSR